MAYIIEISESKLDKMAEHAGKMLKYGGKLMQCLEELQDESESRRMNYRESMQDYRMGYRDEDDPDMMGNRYGERRGVPGTGRRYR